MPAIDVRARVAPIEDAGGLTDLIHEGSGASERPFPSTGSGQTASSWEVGATRGTSMQIATHVIPPAGRGGARMP